MKNLQLLTVICLLFMAITSLGQNQTAPAVNDTTYMLTYDHGGLILWGSDHFRERLKNATEWLDRYPSFKIGLDNEAQIYDYFAEQEPKMLRELKTLLQKYKGRLAIGSCTYGQPLSQFINDESNVRQIQYALNAERKYFNYRPPVYLMSEHAMHSQIPQLIKGFGFDGAIMRTHFMMYGYNPTFDVPIGWWTGIDGSKVATIPTYTGEGAEFGRTPVDNWILTRYPSKESPQSPEDFRKKFAHIRPLLASRADDSGLRKEELVKEYDKKPLYSWILLDELLKKYPAPTADLVTRPNDFVVRMPWGYCGNEIWNDSRKAETSVLTAERLAALEALSGGQPHLEALDASWKALLLAQHHDIQICGLLPEARKLLPLSISRSEQTIGESLAYFAKNMRGEGIRQVTVFNPLSWQQTGWVFARVGLHKGQAKNLVAQCGARRIPVTLISANKLSDGSILEARIGFKADLPPLSLTSFSIVVADEAEKPAASPIRVSENNLITTPFYEVQLAKEGGVASIKEARTGRYLTRGMQRAAFFEGTINGADSRSEGKWIVRQTDGAPWVKMTEYGFVADIPYQFEMTLYDDNPRIDCQVRFDFNGQKIGLLSDNPRDGHSPFVHGGKLRFKYFAQVDSTAVGIRDLPFAIAETTNINVEGNYWTALSDGTSGVAFFNKGTMGSIREKDGSFSIPLAYAMYYIWGTRMLNGPFSYEFAILPFAGSWQVADLHRKALEYSFQLPSVETDPAPGRLGTRVTPFNLSAGDDIILTALYPEKEKVVARFYKAGDRQPLSPLRFEKPGAKMTQVTLDGNPVCPFNGETEFKPWEIKSFRIARSIP